MESSLLVCTDTKWSFLDIFHYENSRLPKYEIVDPVVYSVVSLKQIGKTLFFCDSQDVFFHEDYLSDGSKAKKVGGEEAEISISALYFPEFCSSKMLFGVSDGKKINVIDTIQKKFVSQFFDEEVEAITDIKTSSLSTVLTSHDNGVIKMYDYSVEGKHVRTLIENIDRGFKSNEKHKQSVNCITVDTLRGVLVSCSQDRVVKIWDYNRAKKCQKTYRMKGEIIEVFSIPDTHTVLLSTFDGDLICADLRRLRRQASNENYLWKHENANGLPCRKLNFSFASNLISYVDAQNCYLVDPSNGKFRHQYNCLDEVVQCSCFLDHNDIDLKEQTEFEINQTNIWRKKVSDVAKNVEVVEQDVDQHVIRRGLYTDKVNLLRKKMLEKDSELVHINQQYLRKLEMKKEKEEKKLKEIMQKGEEHIQNQIRLVQKKLSDEKKRVIKEKLLVSKRELQKTRNSITELKIKLKSDKDRKEYFKKLSFEDTQVSLSENEKKSLSVEKPEQQQQQQKKMKKRGILVAEQPSTPKSSSIFTSKFENPFQSMEGEYHNLQMKKQNLKDEVERLEKVNRILLHPDLVNFVYGKSTKDVFVRGYLGFIIHDIRDSGGGENEILFYRDISGDTRVKRVFFKEEFDDDDDDDATSGRKPPKFDEDEIRTMFPMYYGHWKEKDGNGKYDGDVYKIVLEKRLFDLKEYVTLKPDLSSLDKLFVVHRCAKLIGFLHSFKLVHHRISPHSFIFCENQASKAPVIKLFNFGGVRRLPCTINQVKGVFNFTDPNLSVVFDLGIPDPNALSRDVYSLGLLIFFIYLEKLPFFYLIYRIIYPLFDQNFDLNQFPFFLYHIVVLGEDGESSNYDEAERFLNTMYDLSDPVVDELNIALSTCRKKKSFFPLLVLGRNKRELDRIPETVTKLIKRCVSVKENNRPTIEEVVECLEKEISGHPNRSGEGEENPYSQKPVKYTGEEEDEDEKKIEEDSDQQTVEEEDGDSEENIKGWNEKEERGKVEKLLRKQVTRASVHHDRQELERILENQPKSKISTIQISKWKKEEVMEWLGYLYVPEEKEDGSGLPKDEEDMSLRMSYLQIYGQDLSELTGKDLLKITRKGLEELGVSHPLHRNKLFEALEEVREKKTFKTGEIFVYNKLKLLLRKYGGAGKCQDINFMTMCLAYMEQMMKTYLNPFVAEDLINRVAPADEEELERENEIKRQEEKLILGKTKDVGAIPSKLSLDSEEKIKFPMKLVITEITHNSRQRTVRRLLSPIFARLPNFRKEFGMFHTALVFGPWYLEWNASSLCIPRKVYSSMALLTSDLDASSVVRNHTLQEICEKLARVVIKWNTSMIYSRLTHSKTKGNCQDFVESILKEFDISVDYGGCFGRFVKKMRESGECKMVFNPNSVFRNRFQLKLKEYQFDSHKELDEFYYQMADVDQIGLNIDFKDEYKLLKAFDRAFWLRHFKFPEVEIYKCSAKKCPFGDPRKTKSFVTYD